MSRVEVNSFGDKFHYNDQDKLHRVDGPAVEYSNGDKYWWLNDQQHRVDGPAFEGSDGKREWFLNDKYHREDGPAVEWPNGYKAWYLEDEVYTEEEFYVEIAKRHGCDLSTFPQLAYDYCQDHQLI